MARPPRVGVLRLIAIFKLFKALVLLASLATVFDLVRQDDPAHTVINCARPNGHPGPAGAPLLHLNPKQLALLAAGTVLYAVLFSVEGVGLWGARLWAEYLTIIATASFIPIELYEVVKSITVPKAVTFGLNIGIVAYLVVQVRRRGHRTADPRPS
jgi:hypothetical protein